MKNPEKIDCSYFFKDNCNQVASSSMKSTDPVGSKHIEIPSNHPTSQLDQSRLPSFDFNFSPIRKAKPGDSIRSLNLRSQKDSRLHRLELASVDLDENLLNQSIITNTHFRSISNVLLSQTAREQPASLEVSKRPVCVKTVKKSKRARKTRSSKIKQIVFKNFARIFRKSDPWDKPISVDNCLPRHNPDAVRAPKEGFRLHWKHDAPACRELDKFKAEVGSAVRTIVARYSGRFHPEMRRLVGSPNRSLFSESKLSKRDQHTFVESSNKIFSFGDSLPRSKEHLTQNSLINLGHSQIKPGPEPQSRDRTTAKKPLKRVKQQAKTDHPDKSQRLISLLGEARSWNEQINLMLMNCKLPEAKYQQSRGQIRQALASILRYTESDQTSPYTANQMVFYLKMGLPFSHLKASLTSVKVKLQLVFFIFWNFMDRDEAFRKFRDVGSAADLAKAVDGSQVPKQSLGIYIKSQNEVDLEKLFPGGHRQPGAPEPGVLAEAVHRVLLVVLGLIDLMKLFVNRQLDRDVFGSPPRFAEYKVALGKMAKKSKIRDFKISETIRQMSVKQLLSQISVEDLWTHFLLNKLTVKCKSRVAACFRPSGASTVARVELSAKAHRKLFCHRKKRQYVSTKFLFKFVKKHLLRDYGRRSAANRQLPHRLLRRQFDDQFLLCEEVRGLFYSDNINKSTLAALAEKAEKLTGSMRDYVQSRFMPELVDKFYNDFAGGFCKNDYHWTKFGEYFLGCRATRPFVFEDCELGFVVLDGIFKFVR